MKPGSGMRANLPCIFSGSNGHVPPLIEDGCGVKLPREIRGNELKSPSRAVFSFPARRATTTNHKPPTCTTPRTNNDADTTPPVIVNRNAPLDTSPSTLTPKFVNHAVLLINSPPPPFPPPCHDERAELFTSDTRDQNNDPSWWSLRNGGGQGMG